MDQHFIKLSLMMPLYVMNPEFFAARLRKIFLYEPDFIDF